MTSNIQLISMAKKRGINNMIVCMNDQLETFEYPSNGFFILNLEDSDHGGTHWTCLCIRNKIPCYFDSFGGIYSEQVEKYIKKHYGKKCAFSCKIIQDFKSVKCGIYCFALILYILKNPNQDILACVNNFTNLFSDNPILNDTILDKIIKKL